MSDKKDYPLYSSDTDNLALPFARRDANTLRPLAVAILERKPCLFFLFLLEGWNVLFISVYIYYYFSFQFGVQRYGLFFNKQRVGGFF